MNPERESRIYDQTLNAVLGGTAREDIFQMLQSNGFAGQEAEGIYRRARGERIAMLRGDGMRKAAKGALLLGVGIGLFCVFWYGLGFINRAVWVISFGAGSWGFLMFLNGIMDMVLAPNKAGPLSPDI